MWFNFFQFVCMLKANSKHKLYVHQFSSLHMCYSKTFSGLTVLADCASVVILKHKVVFNWFV